MIDDSKHIRSEVDGVTGSKGKKEEKSNRRFQTIPTGSEFLIPVGSGVLQILVGLTLVAVSILGLITPLWLSAFLSLAGSVSTMVGVFLIYYTITSRGSLENLINQSIRRVISDQN